MSAKLQKQLKQNLVWRGLYFIISLATIVITARVLGAEASGEFSFLLTILSLLALLLSLNLDSGFTYFISSKKIALQKLVGFALVWLAVISIAAITILKSNLFLNLINTNILAVNIYQCSINYFIGVVLFSYSIGLFYGLKNFITPNLILAAFGIFYIAIIEWRIYTGNAIQIVPDFCNITLLTGVVLYIVFIIYKKIFTSISITNIAETKQLISYSSIIMLSNLTFFFVYKIDYAFVKSWCSQAIDLGNYIQASKFAQILLVVPQILASTIFPQIANQKDRSEVVQIICRLVRIFVTLFAIIFIVSILIGEWAFPFILGKSFYKMYIPFCILIPGIFSLAISSLFSAYFSGINKNKLNLYAALIALLLMITLSYSCQSIYSINVAAAISTICYIAESSFIGLKFLRAEKIHIRKLLWANANDWEWVLKFGKRIG